jgi:hypothetical protein
MNRRTFLISSGVAGVGALLPAPAVGNTAETDSAERFSWDTGKLRFEFSVVGGRLRQHLNLLLGPVLIPSVSGLCDLYLRQVAV